MAKTATAVTTANTAKQKSAKASKGATNKEKVILAETGKVAVAKKIANSRDLKYNYPKDVETAAQKKTFRSNTKRKLRRLISTVLDIRKGRIGGSINDAKAEATAFAKEHLSKEFAETFLVKIAKPTKDKEAIK